MMRRIVLHRLGWLVAGSGITITTVAQQEVAEVPSITAEVLHVDLEHQLAVYEGNARAEYGDIVFRADEIRWHRSSGRLTAEGHTLLQRGDMRLLAEKLTYEISEESYRMVNVRLGQEAFVFRGAEAEGSADQILFHDAQIFWGEPDRWTPTLSARSITYDPVAQTIRTRGGRMGLGKIQPLPFPAGPIPLTRGSSFVEWELDGGFSSQLGGHGRIGATLPTGERWRAGADFSFFTQRGIMMGPAGGYDGHDSAAGGIHGRFTSAYIRDRGDRGFDNLTDPISPDRGMVAWTHRQSMAEFLTLNADLNYWSDSEVLRDFRRREFYSVQVPDSFAELTHLTPNTVAGVFLRAQPNDFHQIRQRLPEGFLALLPTPVSQGLIHQGQASAVVLQDDPPGPAPAVESTRFDAYYALSRPWAPHPGFSFNPMAGARFTHYANATGGRSHYSRGLGEVGFDAEMKLAGTFDYQNRTWGIDGLRHLITPRLSYRYIAQADKGAAFIPAIDRRVFATYLEPLGLGSRRQIDDLTRTNTLRLALDQRLQTRHQHYGSRDLVRLQMAFDSRFDQPAGSRTLSALHTELKLSPASFLDVELYHRVAPGTWSSRELNAVLTLHSADQWRLQIANHYLRGQIRQVIGGMACRLNEIWEGYARLHFDSRSSRFVEQSFGLRQTIANRWVLDYDLSFREGATRESDFGLSLRIDVVQF